MGRSGLSGEMTDGQLGDGTTTDRSNPVQVVDAVGTPLSSIVAVAGSNHSVFLKSDGSVWTVGFNNAGQLGDGTTSDRNHAERVKDALGNPLPWSRGSPPATLIRSCSNRTGRSGRRDIILMGNWATGRMLTVPTPCRLLPKFSA